MSNVDDEAKKFLGGQIAKHVAAGEAPKIIRHYNDPTKAIGNDGRPIERKEELWVEPWKSMVKVTHYDTHFIYMSNIPESSQFMCTCGSPAVVVPPNAKGIFVCLTYQTEGKHQVMQ